MRERERGSEGQIATALSLSLLLSVFLPLSPPTFHSHSGTFSIYSPFSLYHSISLFFLRSAISLSFALSSSHSPLSFSNFILLAHTHTQPHARKLTHLSCLPSAPQVITSQTHPHEHHINLGFKAHAAKCSETSKHIQATTQVGQLNSICFSAPDGSEGSFQLINNVSSTCIKLNRCLLVIMNVLMGLSDRSGAQTITNSFVLCLFFILCISLLQSPS